MLYIYMNIKKCHNLIGKRVIIYVIVNDINSLLITEHGHDVSGLVNTSYDGLRKPRMQSATHVKLRTSNKKNINLKS